jgi:hypothetical protein
MKKGMKGDKPKSFAGFDFLDEMASILSIGIYEFELEIDIHVASVFTWHVMKTSTRTRGESLLQYFVLVQISMAGKNQHKP